jgi:hypothetical protein
MKLHACLASCVRRASTARALLVSLLVSSSTFAASTASPIEFGAVMAQLFSTAGRAHEAATSVVLARRAVEVCAWLRNDNEYGTAMRVAERVLQRLAAMREETDADRVERLYCESILLAEFLDRKAEALAVLQAAEKLAPDDDRLLSRQLQLAEALAEFGR